MAAVAAQVHITLASMEDVAAALMATQVPAPVEQLLSRLKGLLVVLEAVSMPAVAVAVPQPSVPMLRRTPEEMVAQE